MKSETVRWPFVGRDREAAEIGAALRAGRVAVALVGDSGVGKSRLAASVASRMSGQGWTTVVIRASLAARDVPYGALAHLLPVSSPPGVLNPLRWAAEELTRSGRRRVFLIDDAHLLDPASAAVVNHLVVHRRATVFMTMREGEPAADAITQLVDGDMAARMTIQPLSADDTAVVLNRALNGPVDVPTMRRLVALAEGNPLLLRELVEAARESGALQGPPWRLVGPVPVKASGLVDVIAQRLRTLPEGLSEVIDYLALAEPLPTRALTELCSEGALAQCELRGLVRVSDAGLDGQVRLSHPLYGEFVRGIDRPLTVRRRYRALVEVVGRSADAGRDRLRLAIWRLEADLTQDTDGLVAAARIAWAAHDYQAAHRLAAAAVQGGGNVEASILLATILNFTMQFDAASRVLAGIPEDADLPARLRKDLALTRAMTMSVVAGGDLDALAMLETEQQNLIEVEFKQDLELLRIDLTANALGDMERARELAQTVLEAPPASSAIRAQVLSYLTIIDGMNGRFIEASEAARTALAEVEQWRDAVPVIVIPLHMNWCASAIQVGSLVQAQEALDLLVKETAGRSGFAMADNALLWGRAQLLSAQGRLKDAVEATSSVAIGPMVTAIQAHRAGILAMMGDVAGAERTLQLAKQSSGLMPGGPVVEHLLHLAQARLEAARGDISAAVTLALKCAEEARERPAVPFEMGALQIVVSLGAAHQAVDRLVELARDVQGELIQLMTQQAVAVVNRDGRSLLDVAGRFAELGYSVFAADAAARAATIVAASTGPNSARASNVAARAAALIGRCQQLRLPAALAVATPQLTAREWQVAKLAADGRTSSQIAEQLGLSVRTVDNHLQHAYTKLGVTSRQELGTFL